MQVINQVMNSHSHRFADFELVPSQRSLLLHGQEIALQPLVFDLLWYLVEHRDRVVSKDELLNTLWRGMVVTESSLQRAVSLARGALQQGGLDHAIRNYAKRGYRFEVEVSVAASSEPDSQAKQDHSVDRAEQAFQNGDWQQAMQIFAETDRIKPLAVAALERWGTAAQCAGDLSSAIAPLERAAIIYSSLGEREAAARVLISLARIQMESLDLAVAQGCLRRAQRLLDGLSRGEQHGYLAWMQARLHLNKGELTEAIRLAQEAYEIGQQLGNADIESMSIVIRGVGLQASGDVLNGMALQDEAAAVVLSGDVSPLVGGIVYCGVITSCCNVGDWQRARQWTDSFTRWSQRSNIDTFAGACLIHQAEIHAMSGNLDNAQDAIQRADPLIRLGAPWALGDAYRLMGEIHLARGELSLAEKSFQHAYQHGWDPYPGYAELLHMQGRVEEAVHNLEQAAAVSNWTAQGRKSRYLAHAARLAAMSGQREKTLSLLKILDQEAQSWEASATAAQVHCARAELAILENNGQEAQHLLRRALDALEKRGAVMEAARVHLRLAEILSQQGNLGAAMMELSAAEIVFEQARAEAYLAECRALRQQMSPS